MTREEQIRALGAQNMGDEQRAQYNLDQLRRALNAHPQPSEFSQRVFWEGECKKWQRRAEGLLLIVRLASVALTILTCLLIWRYL